MKKNKKKTNAVDTLDAIGVDFEDLGAVSGVNTVLDRNPQAGRRHLNPSLLSNLMLALVQGLKSNFGHRVKPVTLKLIEEAKTRTYVSSLDMLVIDQINDNKNLILLAPAKDSNEPLELGNNTDLIYIGDAIESFEKHIRQTMRSGDHQLDLSCNTLLIPLIQCGKYKFLGMTRKKAHSVLVEVVIDRNTIPANKKISVYDSQKSFFENNYPDVLEDIAEKHGYAYVTKEDYHSYNLQDNHDQCGWWVYSLIKAWVKDNWTPGPHSQLALTDLGDLNKTVSSEIESNLRAKYPKFRMLQPSGVRIPWDEASFKCFLQSNTELTPKIMLVSLKAFYLDLDSSFSSTSVIFFKVNTQSSARAVLKEFLVKYQNNLRPEEDLFIEDLRKLFGDLDNLLSPEKNGRLEGVYQQIKDNFSSHYPELLCEKLSVDELSAAEQAGFTLA